MIYLYRILYFFAKITALALKPFLPDHLQAWVQLRRQPQGPLNKITSPYWFHAASGEIEYCKSVIRLLKEKQPECKIVLSYTSTSAEKLFHNIKNEVDLFIPLCWDQPKAVKRLLDYLNPKMLIFSRTDLWPELIYQTKKRKIPMGLISALPRDSFFTNYLRRQMNFISSVDQDGDTRFDQVFFRLSHGTKITLEAEQLFVCGSTWPEDEEVLFQIFPKLIEKNIKIVLSPHDVSEKNIERLSQELKQRLFTFQLLSFHAELSRNILLIDRIGFLADTYRTADFAFVGGSYKDKIHSVMEALCCGVPVITGPYFRNNPEAVMYQNKFVFPTESPDEVLAAIQKCLKIDKNEIKNEMRKNLNASQKVLELILHTAQET